MAKRIFFSHRPAPENGIGRIPAIAVLLLATHLAGVPAWGAVTDVRIENVPESVIVGEPFTFQIKVTTDGTEPPRPKIPSFENVIIGPAQMPPIEGTSWVNGVVSRSVTVGYIARVQSEQLLTLSGIAAEGVEAPPVSVRVVQRGQQQPSATLPPLFVRAEVNKTEVWQGEQIVFDYYLYTSPRLTGNPQGPLTVPTLQDALKKFMTQDVPVKIQLRDTVFQGQQLRRALLLRRVLFPLSPGTYEIPPIPLEGRWDAPLGGRDNDPFRGFGLFSPSVPLDRLAGEPVQNQPITIKVRPLPQEGRPAGFSGTVGVYTLGAQLDKNEVRVGEPLTLQVSISGDGHIDSVGEPDLKLPPAIEKYDSEREAKEEYNAVQNRLQGRIQYDFVLIPRQEGDFILEPIEFIYFDPGNGQYRTLSQGPFKLKVTPDEGGGGGSVYLQGNRKRIRVTGEDFRHLRPAIAIDLDEDVPPAQETVSFWGLMASPWLVFGVVLARKRRREFLLRNPDVAARLRSKNEVRGLLAKAEQLVDQGGDPFFSALETAVHDHLSALYGVATRGMTHSQLESTLTGREAGTTGHGKKKGARNLSPEEAKSVSNLLQNLERYRYAPTQGGVGENRRILEEVRQVLEYVKG
jgi:hypothetical protein